MIKVAIIGAGETGITAMIEALGVDYYDADASAVVGETARQLDEECGVHLHIISAGEYNVARAVDSAQRPGKTCLLHVLEETDDLQAVSMLIQERGGIVGNGPDLGWVIEYLTDLKSITRNRHANKALKNMEAKFRGPYIRLEKGENTVVKITLQSGPVSEVGVDGCSARDMLEYTLRLFEVINDELPGKENGLTVQKLREGLRWQDRK